MQNSAIQTSIKYSFHSQSIFARYLDMGLKSKNLYAFAQNKNCKHSFGCLEYFIRKLTKNAGMYIIGKYFYELVCPSERKVKSVIDAFSETHLKLSDGWR